MFGSQMMREGNRSQTGFAIRPNLFDTSNQSLATTERLYAHRISDKKMSRRLLEDNKMTSTCENFLKRTRLDNNSPFNKHLWQIRYDQKGSLLKRSVCGSSDEHGRAKNFRSERGFSLRRLNDKFLCKPKVAPKKSGGLIKNAKVIFNTGINTGKNSGADNDPNSKTISVRNGDGSFTRVHAHRFTDENLNSFIQDYINRKTHDEDSDNYTSMFYSSMSSIKTAKD